MQTAGIRLASSLRTAINTSMDPPCQALSSAVIRLQARIAIQACVSVACRIRLQQAAQLQPGRRHCQYCVCTGLHAAMVYSNALFSGVLSDMTGHEEDWPEDASLRHSRDNGAGHGDCCPDWQLPPHHPPGIHPGWIRRRHRLQRGGVPPDHRVWPPGISHQPGTLLYPS